MKGVEKQIRDFMAEANDTEGAPLRRSYIICSSPRVGSNMLAQALRSTGMGGLPFEYFNPMALRAYGERSGVHSMALGSYIKFLQSRRIGSDGTFAVKMHFHQLDSLIKSPEQKVRFLSLFDRIVFLGRANKLRQAISNIRAQESGVWYAQGSADVEMARVASRSYDVDAILSSLRFMIADEKGWRGLFRDAGRSHIGVSYEEIVGDYARTMQRVADHLGMEVRFESGAVPPTWRLGDETNDLWERNFLEDILGRGSAERRRSELEA